MSTYRTHHEWVDGASVLGAQLATCAHCGTMRVTDESRHPSPRFILRVSDPQYRDGFEMPPCLEASAPKGARERAVAMNRARAREQAVRSAVNAAPPEVDEAAEPPRSSKMLTHFPWYSDMHRTGTSMR